MKMARNSITRCLLATAVIAFCLAPLVNLSDLTIFALFYIKFGLVVLATFLARLRSGRSAAWWFGFATFGWALLLIGESRNTMTIELTPNIDLSNLTNSLVMFLMRVRWQDRIVDRVFWIIVCQNMYSVVQFWFVILAALTGGYLSLFLHDRQSRRRGDAESTQPLDTLNYR